jgi:Ca2+-binding EF-hand superfamily protein
MRRNDADGDGRISRDEFRGPAAFFERADADKDGFVTAEEARAARGRAGSPAPDRPGPGAFGEPGGPVMLLRRLDADHDDRLSRHEWDDFFRKADENGDEILRLEEWRAALRGEPFKDDAPQVGVPAPKVKAKSLKSGRELDLSQPKRTTVLVFGSHT